MEEYISVNEYMRRFKIGHKNVLKLIATNQVEYQITETGRYRIKVGSDTVNIENLWKELKKCGITNEKELDEAIAKMKPLNIGGFVNKTPKNNEEG